MFSAPYAVGVKRPNGTTIATGHLKPGGYKAFFDSLRSQPGGWGGLIKTRSDGTILRALAPGHGIEAGAPLLLSVMNDYVNRVWSKYSSQTLTVQPFKDQPNTKYFGRVQGNTMNFTNSSGAVVTSFQKPDSDSIFGCYKLLDAPNDLVRGPISRTLCRRLQPVDAAQQPQPARREQRELLQGRGHQSLLRQGACPDGRRQGVRLRLRRRGRARVAGA